MIQNKMKALSIVSPGHAEIVEVTTPTPVNGEVLIKIDTCLLCTWEQRIFKNGAGMKLPFIPGHEIAGHIAAIGEGTITSFKVGDAVVAKTLDSCGHCEFCYRGNDNQCTGAAKKRVYDNIPSSGGLAQYIALSVSRVYPIENIPMEIAAFAEPVACCVRSLENANIELGEDVVIVGGGIMGQLHNILAKKRGARTILVELDKSRLEMAKKAGADIVINPSECDPIEKIMEITGGSGAHVVFFTLPIAKLAEDYIGALGKMGRMVYYGSFQPADDIAINPNKIHYSEKIITGSYSPTSRGFWTASKLLGNGIIDVAPFLSKLYPLDAANAAFESAMSPATYRVGIKLWE